MSNLRILSILVQSSVAFVGLSIILGRTYFITYFDTLGIPTTEVSHNVTDYSIISPVIPLISVLVIFLPAIAFLGIEPMQNKSGSFPNVIVGILIAASGGLAVLFFPLTLWETGWIRHLPGILSVVGITFIPLGGALVLSGMSVQTTDDQSGWNAALSLGPQGTKTAFTVLITALLVLVAGFSFAQSTAERHARETITEAPRAHVDLKPSAGAWTSDFQGCSSEAGECVYRVVLIGDHFVYLVDVGQSSSNLDASVLPTRYAVPISDVSTITYLPGM